METKKQRVNVALYYLDGTKDATTGEFNKIPMGAKVIQHHIDRNEKRGWIVENKKEAMEAMEEEHMIEVYEAMADAARMTEDDLNNWSK